MPERRRAKLVIEKLGKSFRRYFSIEAVLWEIEPMLASGHFQDQIIPPSETDIVVLIVWSRLGTPLPQQTSTRAYRGLDGRAPVTGTEWEFEDALAAQKARGAPDLLAYRKQADPTVSLRNKAAKQTAEDQWEKLDSFWNRWFVDRGEFRAAFAEFIDLDSFETRLESDLTRLIERRIHAGSADAEGSASALSWVVGSPFRGLEAYRFEHAPIFFGRSAAINAAVEQLIEHAEAGCAFLLVLGASGSGKSSLAQAGVVPALAGQGIIPRVGLWRRAVVRPGGHSDGPFAALAHSIVEPSALPELLSGQTVEALARHLRAAAQDSAFPIITTLNLVDVQARSSGELLAIETANFVLVADQLEELFTMDISAEERVAFVDCLRGLARSGRIFVVATMRSDHWHRAAETQSLVQMAAGKGRLDLLPPLQDETLEMIRQPALAAGLTFETDPDRQIKLDATLARDASGEPGALPLLSFLLDELYKRDVQHGRTTLTYSSAHALGGLKGAIASRAEAVFAGLPPLAREALPRVLRALVTVSGSRTPTSRAVPVELFKLDTAARQLIEALLDPQARLLVADVEGERAQIRIAHEALISHWERAKQQINRDREDLRTRSLIDQAYVDWRDARPRDKSRLLLRDPQLANALDLAKRWRSELDPAIVAFIDISRNRARRLQQLTIAAAAVFAVVAGLAAWQSYQAVTARDAERRMTLQAQQSLEAAEMSFRHAETMRRTADVQRKIAQEERDRALVAQSKVLAEFARRARQQSDYTLGALVALEGLPDATTKQERPFVSEAFSELYANVFRSRQNKFLPTKISLGEGQRQELFSPDGKRMLTRNNDGGDTLWDLETGQIVSDVAAAVGGHSEQALISPDGRRIAVLAGRLYVFDTVQGKLLWSAAASGGGLFHLAFSPDSRLIAAGGTNVPVTVWEADRGEQKFVVSDELEWARVWPITFSPNGKLILARNQASRTTLVWDVVSGKKVAVVDGETLGFATDGSLFVTSREKFIGKGPEPSLLQPRKQTDYVEEFRAVDAGSGKIIAQFETFRGCMFLRAAKFSSGESKIILFCGGRVEIWDLRNGQQVTGLYEVDGANFLAFSPEGGYVFSWSSKENAVRIQATQQESVLISKKLSRETPPPFKFSPDGTLIVMDDGDRITVLSYPLGRTIAEIPKAAGWIGTFSADSKLLSTISPDGVAVWNVNSEQLFIGHSDQIMGAAISPSGQTAATRDFGRLIVWDLKSKELLWDFDVNEGVENDGSDFPVQFNRDGTRLFISGRGVGWLFQAHTGQLLKKFSRFDGGTFSADGQTLVVVTNKSAEIVEPMSAQTLVQFEGRAETAALSPDGSLVFIGEGRSGTLWKVASKERLHLLEGHTGRVLDGSFSRDGQRLLTSSIDKTARIWDVATGKELVALSGHAAQVYRARFTPDGRRAISVSEDGTVRIWDVGEGTALAILPARSEPSWFTFADISPDGRLVATPYTDNTARVWEVESGQQIAILDGHKDSLRAAVFTPDASQLLTAGRDQTARLWPIVTDHQALVDTTKKKVARCLTGAERKEAFLSPEPPAWCIEMEKWPYRTQAWKDWQKPGWRPVMPNAE